MPSMFAARTENGAQSGSRSFSRVNSFKREWGDDEDPASSAAKKRDGSVLKGSSREIEWSPSPERVKRKGSVPLAEIPVPPQLSFIPGETAAEKRRRAIMAAMSEDSQRSTVSAVPSTLSSSTLPSASSSSASIPSAQRYRPTQPTQPQALPSLPELSTLNAMSRKRELPWDEELGETKKNRSISATSTTSSSKRSSSSTSTRPPALNIKQRIVLSQEQQKVLTLVVQEGKNLFFTGSAGTGKSVLLREIIKSLRKKYATAPDAVAVTASTGIAACNIGGVTLHSFGGVGLGLEKPEVLVSKIRKNKKAAARWLRTKVLIIDEVSMVDGALFDKLCKIGQMMRKQPDRPWGGIQIIVTGDFFQLPPVTKGGATTKFCFEAVTWSETIAMSVNLNKVFRQKDQRFVDMLNEMRFGKLTSGSIQAFKALSRPIQYNDGIDATELFPRREDVDRSNHYRLEALNTDGWTYLSTDGGAITDPVQREKILQNFMASNTLKLKVDAQVMLIKNIDETLVNGSMGKVIGFEHKQLYVADTQGRWIENGEMDGLDEDERERKSRMRQLVEAKLSTSSKPLPVVRFKVPGGGVRDMLVENDIFKSELPNGEVQVSRSQLPLILAWAMSIHKSQGQTLDRVKVDLGKVFEKGQAYVALSRATCLEGLQVLNFSADKVMAHRKVAQWSTQLRDLNET